MLQKPEGFGTKATRVKLSCLGRIGVNPIPIGLRRDQGNRFNSKQVKWTTL
jgi:hypothetical protein